MTRTLRRVAIACWALAAAPLYVVLVDAQAHRGGVPGRGDVLLAEHAGADEFRTLVDGHGGLATQEASHEGSYEGREGEEFEGVEENSKEGEGEEVEEFNNIDLAISVMLLGAIGFVMSMFMLLNHPDKDMRYYSWSVISTTLSIFVAVLLYEGFATVLHAMLSNQSVRLMVSFVELLIYYGLLQLTSAWTSGCFGKEPLVNSYQLKKSNGEIIWNTVEMQSQKRHKQIKCWVTLMSHMTGFAAIGAGKRLMSMPIVRHHLPLSFVVAFFMLAVQFLLAMSLKRFRVAIRAREMSKLNPLEGLSASFDNQVAEQQRLAPSNVYEATRVLRKLAEEVEYHGPEEFAAVVEEICTGGRVEARRHIVELVRRASEDRPDVDFERDLRSHLTDDPDWTRHGHFSVSSMSLRGLVALAQAQVPEARRNLKAYAMHSWDEEAYESENEIIGLCFSFLFVEALKLCVSGGHEVEHRSQVSMPLCLSMLGVAACAAVGTVSSMMYYHKLDQTPKAEMPFGEEAARWIKRSIIIAETAFAMTLAWSLLAFTELQVFRHIPDTLASSRESAVFKVTFALVVSLLVFLAIRSLDLIADMESTGDSIDLVLFSIISALGILVGFSWEQSFHLGLEVIAEEIQLNAAGELIFTLMVASIALVPWAKYILTKQLHLEHERKEMVFKKKEAAFQVSSTHSIMQE